MPPTHQQCLRCKIEQDIKAVKRDIEFCYNMISEMHARGRAAMTESRRKMEEEGVPVMNERMHRHRMRGEELVEAWRQAPPHINRCGSSTEPRLY
jgi:hypothetical protein